MFLSVITFVLVGPMIIIAGWVFVFSYIISVFKWKDEEESKQTTPTKYNIRYETPSEEERRIDEWGYDDERWGKLWYSSCFGLSSWRHLLSLVSKEIDNMDVVYEIVIVVWVVLGGWIIISSGGGRYLLRKPKNDYERKQREIQKRRDIE